MTAFNVKEFAVTASVDGQNILIDPQDPLVQFCADLQDNRAPFHGPWWPTKSELNNLCLWTCLDNKYSQVGRSSSGFDIDFTNPSEHVIDVQNGQWIPLGGQGGGLSFPVSYGGNNALLAISFR